MKIFYIFLNMFLFILAVLLLVLNLTFKPHVQDKILSMAPDLKKSAFVVSKIKGEREEVPGVSALWENNLFSPYRSGDGGPLLGTARPVGMELLGVSRLGDIAGAVIIDKTPSISPSAPPTRIRGSRGVAPAASSSQASAPKFWKLGEQLPNGFFLSEVNNDSVVLSRGREQIVLKLDYSSQESLSRNASAAEAAAAASAKLEVKPPVVPPVPGKGGRQIPAPPAPPGVQQDQDNDSPSPAVVKPE
ncbi:MAG TPA: hypothetical protein DET40_04170 [Lentisphaeria bacterium]|nr:MAG: hypothetical protein A2X45_06420 [Lentisphaerae bacterium GWF2_50_93]HCE42722.1 hypothetical protein [Lentisphaeria bacterium]